MASLRLNVNIEWVAIKLAYNNKGDVRKIEKALLNERMKQNLRHLTGSKWEKNEYNIPKEIAGGVTGGVEIFVAHFSIYV